MDKVVNELQSGLREGITSTDLTKGVGNNLSKLLDKFKKEYGAFSKLTEGGSLDFSRSAEGIKAGKNLLTTFEELQRIMGDISTKSTLDLKKMFPEAFNSRVDSFRKSLNGLLGNLDDLAKKNLSKSTLETEISNLEAKISGLRNELTSEADMKIKSDDALTAKKRMEDLGTSLKQLRERFNQKVELKLDTNAKEIERINKELAEIEKRNASRKGITVVNKTTRYEGKKLEDWKKSEASSQKKAGARKAIESFEKDRTSEKELRTKLRKLADEQVALNKISEQGGGGKSLSKTAEILGEAQVEISKARKLQKDYEAAVEDSAAAVKALTIAEDANRTKQDEIERDSQALEKKRKSVNSLTEAIQSLTQKTDLSVLENQLKELNLDFSPELLKSEQGIEQLYKELDRLDEASCEKLLKELEQMEVNAVETTNKVKAVRDGLEDVGNASKDIKRANDEMENLKDSILQFFSLSNAVQLFKNTVRSALETVKELDATMTEAAVVTDFSVGDMWAQLPRYSKEAQKLGVSINGMYQATTLYYQQGLKTNEAMELGVETMKMAKIAAMDSTKATTAMTSALRGFNMELNETSATRVNDVYSQLAAVTAADTNQIANAMEKTASIASSANMEFETTAAFLAQIIETTQEAPETAGTALKTIIARFSEVKNLASQGLVSGEDSEGEVIDVNKIQTALRTVGISMDDFFAGTEGLDSVLLKLAEKWGSLDFETQRYIATMAAGSRQQSRFIAMMSDYGRTQELVTAANNSAGASQRQFEKTAESLQSSLTKLKNAWDQFSMGLANNEILKAGIDTLTFLLETLNKIIDAISGGNGLVKSVASLAVAFGGLKIGGNLIKSLTQSFGAQLFQGAGINQQVEKVGKESGEKLIANMTKEIASNKSVSTVSTTYNLLLAKVQSSLPKIEFEIKKDAFAGTAILEKNLAEIRQEKALLNKETEDYLVLEELEEEIVEKLSEQYIISGAAVDHLSDEQKELITQKMLEGKLTASQIALLGPEATARVAAALAADKQEDEIEELNWARATEKNLQAGGLKGLFTEIGLRNTSHKATGLQTKSIGELAKAKGTEALEWIKANKAMLTGIATVAIFAATIAAVVTGIVKLVKAFKEAGDLSKQIEKIDNQIAEMSDQIAEASNKIDEITSAESDLKNLQDGFKGLTKGTKEWKEQLVKANNTVLELINKYPELTSYVIQGEEGQMDISEEGWDVLVQQSQQQYSTLLATQTGLQLQKNQVQQQMAFENALSSWEQRKLENERVYASDEYKSGSSWVGAGAIGTVGAAIGTAIAPGIGTAIGAGIGAIAGAITGSINAENIDNMTSEEQLEQKATGGLTQEEFSKFASAAAEKGLSISGGNLKGNFEDLFNQMGFDEEVDFSSVWQTMYNMGDKFDTLASKTYGLQVAQETYTESLLKAIGQNEEFGESEYFDSAVQARKNQEKESGEEIASKVKGILNEDNGYVDKYGKATEKMIAEYAEATGEDKDAIRGKISQNSLSVETMASAIASSQVNKKQAKALEDTVKELEKIASDNVDSKDSVNSLMHSLSKDGTNLSRTDIQNIEDSTGMSMDEILQKSEDEQKEIIQQYLKTLNTSLDLIGTNAETFVDNWRNAVDNFSDLERRIDGLQLQSSDISGNLSKKNATNLVNHLYDSLYAVGREGDIPGFVDIINQILPKDEEQQNFFVEALNSLDWDNIESIEDFSEKIEELGIAFNGTEEDLEKFEDELKKISGATTNKTLTERRNELTGTSKLISQVLSGEHANGFSLEELTDLGIKTKKDETGKILDIDDENFEYDTRTGQYYYKGENLVGYIKTKAEEKTATTKANIDDINAKFETAVKQDENIKNAEKSSAGVEKGRNNYNRTITKEEFGRDYIIANAIDTAKNIKFGTLDIDKDNQKTFWDYMLELSETDSGRSTLVEGTGLDPEIFKNFKEKSAERQGALMTQLLDGWALSPYESTFRVAEQFYSTFANPEEPQYTMGTVLNEWVNTEGGGTDKLKTAFNDYTSGQNFIGSKVATVFNEKYEVLDGEKVQSLSVSELLDQIRNGAVKTKGEVGGKTDWYITRGGLLSLANIVFKDEPDVLKSFENATDEEILNAIKNRSDTVSVTLSEATTSKENLDDEYTTLLTYSLTSQEAFGYKGSIPEGTLRDALTTRAQSSGATLLASKFEQQGLSKNMALANATDFMENERVLKDIIGLFSQYQTVLTNTNRYTLEYAEALQQVKINLQATFGDEIDNAFILEHRELLENAIQGDEQAWNTFIYMIAQKKSMVIEELSDFSGFANKLESLQVGVPIEFDLSSYLTTVNGITEITEETQNQLYELAKTLGVTLTIETEVKEVDGEEIRSLVGATATKNNASSMFEDLQESAKNNKWENPYDVFYNTLAKINKSLRERERLEREYQRLMDRGDATGKKLLNNLELQAAELQEEANLQRDIVKGREQQMKKYVASQGLQEYAWIEDGEVRINWAEINKISDSEKGQKVEDYISQLEEWSESLKEAEDRLEEIEDEVHELNEAGKDQYLDLEQAVADALRESYQKQIDELSNINDSINNTNAKMIEAMQASIEQDRQTRENEKTEQQIADKQTRLAYLQQDTSGANISEIMQLEKEITEEQESYTDSLIDQKISQLQEQNDKAAEQRERQIEIAQAQLDQWFENGGHWQKVQDLIIAGTDATGKLLDQSELKTLLQDKASFDGMSAQSKMEWLKQTESDVAAAWAWLHKNGEYLVDTANGSSDNPDSDNIDGSVQGQEQPDGSNDFEKIRGLQAILQEEGYYAGEQDGKYGKITKSAVVEYQKDNNLKQDSSNWKAVLDDYDKKHKYSTIVGTEWKEGSTRTQHGLLPGSFDQYFGKFTVDGNGIVHLPRGADTYLEDKLLPKNAGPDAHLIYVPDKDFPESKKNGKYYGITRYKTGGLADYTGPAWLDGTKSRPELVLNAQDTQNFIQLKDILSSIMSKPIKSSENIGDTTYDIDINIETIREEADLDMISNYIENKIITSANYRGNNFVSTSR